MLKGVRSINNINLDDPQVFQQCDPEGMLV